MTSEILFGLEHAGWPALLVDGASAVCRPNAAARKLFGSALDGDAPTLAAIWAQENNGSPEQFLARWERSPSPNDTLQPRAKGGAPAPDTAVICAFAPNDQKCFVLQLLPENPAIGTSPKSHSSDTVRSEEHTPELQPPYVI